MHEGVRMHLVKVETPGGKQVYVTNLPKSLVQKQEMKNLYRMRWEIELYFRDLSTSLTLEKWHSKPYEKILQELYVRFWVLNAARLLMSACQNYAEVGRDTYVRASFKACMRLVVSHLHRYWTNFSRLIAGVKVLVRQTSERRIVDKRLNERVIKSPRSPYKYRSTEWQWDKKYA